MSSDHSETTEVENVIPVERNDIVSWAAGILEKQRNYINIKLLGSGTFGDVRLMHDPKLNTSVAVKIVKGDKISEGELYLWPYLHHLNVVPLMELLVLGEKREVAIFIMPVQSKTLIDALYEWYIMQLDNVPIWFHDILLGLEYLHSRHFCHMDLKADNVLISETKVAKICDFTFLNETTKSLTRSAVGSPLIYDPPEACRSLGPGVRVSGEACDMWCFGVMCLEVLTRFKLDRHIVKSDDFSWFKNVYPAIFKMLQVGRFFRLMDAAFVAAKIDSVYSGEALDFVHGFLAIDSEKRARAEEATQHSFLLKRATPATAPRQRDSFWTHKVTDEEEGFEIYKNKCLKHQNKQDENTCTREEEPTEIVNMDHETKQVFSSSDDSDSESNDELVCINDNSNLSDKSRTDFVEEEEENGRIEETSERESNGGTNGASSAEDNISNKSNKISQKRQRPGIRNIVRWVARKVRGKRNNKSRMEACLEEIDTKSCTELKECEMSIGEKIVQDYRDPKESRTSSNEKQSKMEERPSLVSKRSQDDIDRVSARMESQEKSWKVMNLDMV